MTEKEALQIVLQAATELWAQNTANSRGMILRATRESRMPKVRRFAYVL
jgi:hypothetical protein